MSLYCESFGQYTAIDKNIMCDSCIENRACLHCGDWKELEDCYCDECASIIDSDSNPRPESSSSVHTCLTCGESFISLDSEDHCSDCS